MIGSFRLAVLALIRPASISAVKVPLHHSFTFLPTDQPNIEKVLSQIPLNTCLTLSWSQQWLRYNVLLFEILRLDKYITLFAHKELNLHSIFQCFLKCKISTIVCAFWKLGIWQTRIWAVSSRCSPHLLKTQCFCMLYWFRLKLSLFCLHQTFPIVVCPISFSRDKERQNCLSYCVSLLKCCSQYAAPPSILRPLHFNWLSRALSWCSVSAKCFFKHAFTEVNEALRPSKYVSRLAKDFEAHKKLCAP